MFPWIVHIVYMPKKHLFVFFNSHSSGGGIRFIDDVCGWETPLLPFTTRSTFHDVSIWRPPNHLPSGKYPIEIIDLPIENGDVQ